VRDLVAGSDVILEDHGTYLLKGIDGDWQLLAVTRPRPRWCPSVTLGISRQPSWRCTGTRRYAVSDRCAAEHATMVKGNRQAGYTGS
jgi:hypothetical protein